MRTALLALLLPITMMLSPRVVEASLTAQEIIAIAQRQLSTPSEFVLGEMRVYRGEHLNRFYGFVLGRLWNTETHTEYVRIDFTTAIDSAIDGSSQHSDHRYLLKRSDQTLPTQWLYLPALRRVRITPYRSDDPLLQSDYLFYDLTTIQDFADYRYHFVNDNEQTPVIEGEPQNALAPYERIVFELDKRGETYIVIGVKSLAHGKAREARFSTFLEIAPGRYRPREMVIKGEGGRTEVVFQHWMVSAPLPQLFTPTHLETSTLVVPTGKE